MINRYFDPTIFKGEFYSPPVDALDKVFQQAQAQYDKNYAIADEIRNRGINALDPDRKRADQIQAETTAKIDDLVKQYNGDYSKANAGLRDLLSNVRRQYQPGGEVAAIEKNYSNYSSWLSNEQKRLNEGKITADDLNLANQYVLNNYGGIGNKSDAGVYNSLQPVSLSEYTDGSKMVLEALKGIKPRKQTVVAPRKDANGNIFNVTEEIEAIDPDEANTAVRASLLSDDKWVEYTRQKAELLGVDPMEYVAGQLQNYEQTYVPLHSGVFNKVNKEEYKGLDELTKIRMQQSHDIAMQRRREQAQKNLVDYKHKLDNPDEGVVRPLEQIGNNPTNTNFKPIKPGETGAAGYSEGLSANPLGNVLFPLLAPFTGLADNLKTQGKTYPSVQVALSGKSKLNVNYKLLQDISREQKGKSDAQIWEAYNDALALSTNYGAQILMDPYVQGAQQAQAADQLIPRYINNGATVYEINPNGGLIPVTDTNVLAGMYDFEKRKAKVPVIGTTSSVAGNVPVGHVVQSGSKKYIISDNSTVMRNYNEANQGGKSIREKAFGHIREGKTFSEPFELITDDNQRQTTMGVTNYVGGVPKTTYYSAVKDPFTKEWRPIYEDPWIKPGPGGTKQPMNEHDIERRILGNQYDLLRQHQKAPSKAETEFIFDGSEL
jgi:hypothetical protein